MHADDALLLYTDGLVEVHDANRAMLGFERLRGLLCDLCAGEAMLTCLMRALNEFVGEGWVQEDDITMVALRRLG